MQRRLTDVRKNSQKLFGVSVHVFSLQKICLIREKTTDINSQHTSDAIQTRSVDPTSSVLIILNLLENKANPFGKLRLV